MNEIVVSNDRQHGYYKVTISRTGTKYPHIFDRLTAPEAACKAYELRMGVVGKYVIRMPEEVKKQGDMHSIFGER